ncbi:hypothetical protein [Curtobacterium sp. MCBD17_040]|uniref:hypothetical protein n=1 Tax=Curtobacterium sp. MCBD17_040 TaxID=2175674 RepID=UPI000DA99139|nr:hypothetical protein [Curtobacterium sp. MCBD17_040]WIB63742.1 hypothetical protein DEI94_00720 [Curtobacterium sp. MCBD17_040]
MQQVLMHRAGTATPRFELRENPRNQAPLSFEDAEAGVRVPRLGSQDLLAIARYAADVGFHIDGFIIEDHTLSPVPTEETDELSETLVNILARDGAFAAALFLDDEFGFYVTGVRLTSADLRSFTLLREGVTRSPAETHLEDFLARAWTVVHFS